jgi:hypothetical protein
LYIIIKHSSRGIDEILCRDGVKKNTNSKQWFGIDGPYKLVYYTGVAPNEYRSGIEGTHRVLDITREGEEYIVHF